MESKRYGEIDVVLKAAGDEDESGTFEAILSAPTLDRDGEIIAPGAFEPLPDWIPIDIDHDLSVASTIGSGRPYYDGDLLKIRGTFSSLPRAQEVRTLVNERHVRKMSVVFRAAQYDEEQATPTIVKAELLNAAIVPIPSNRDADILAAKAAAVASWIKRSNEDLPSTETTDKAAVDATSPEELAETPADMSVLKEWARAKAALAEAELALSAIPPTPPSS